MRVVFAGGGTGGHLYPAIAIAEALHERAQVDFIGTNDRLEATIVPKAGFRVHFVRSRALKRWPLPEVLRTLRENAIGIVQSLGLVRRLRPDVLVATGGYVCFPVVVAARLLRAVGLFRGAIALFEPNARPGLTHRVLAPFVDEVWGAFARPDSRDGCSYVHTGTPVRAAIRRGSSRACAIARFGLAPQRRTILAIGGSQGARSLNDALIALIGNRGMSPGWQLLHLTGERDYEHVRGLLGDEPSSTIRPYLDDMSDAYAVADLVLARSGASTLAEVIALGLPSLLVPYPHAAEDHQRHNAELLRSAGAAEIITDRELQAGVLPVTLGAVTESTRLEAMRAAAIHLQKGNPVAVILARIDTLAARMPSS